MRLRLTGLWRDPGFQKLWLGYTVSLAGSSFVFLAIPLTAVVALDASPLEMGILSGLTGLPALVVGVPFGVWADRHRKRPILIAADFARAALLLTIPIAYMFDALSLWVLYIVAIGIGTMSLFFEIGLRSLVPAVVERDQLVDANSNLELARSGAGIGGQGIGAALIQIAAAPIAIFFSVGAYLLSAALFSRMRVDESSVERQAESEQEGGFRSALAGMKFIRDNRILMGVAASNGTLNLFKAAIEAVAILYIVRELEVPPAMLGVIFAIGSLSLIPAALAASRLPRRFGVGRTLLLTVGVIVLSDLVVPILAGPLWFILVALLDHETFLATGFISFSVSQVSLRQSLTPDSMQGRMNSLMTVSARSAVPIGALIGGVMGEFIGLREALFIAVVGEAASVIWLIYFGVWRVKEMPSLDAAHQN